MERQSGLQQGPSAGPCARPSVLVVEDATLIGLDVVDTLELAGFSTCGPIATVDGALEALAASNFAAAVLDVRLGEETSDAVATALADRNIPFVVVSGYESRTLPGALGAAPQLSKPFSSARLVEVLTAAMRSFSEP